eukprot:COSAG02_NODE_1881_length_10542_cov_179.778991_5_plen_169_part_00
MTRNTGSPKGSGFTGQCRPGASLFKIIPAHTVGQILDPGSPLSSGCCHSSSREEDMRKKCGLCSIHELQSDADARYGVRTVCTPSDTCGRNVNCRGATDGTVSSLVQKVYNKLLPKTRPESKNLANFKNVQVRKPARTPPTQQQPPQTATVCFSSSDIAICPGLTKCQ